MFVVRAFVGEERSGFIDKNNPENTAQLVLFIRVIGILLYCERASFNIVIRYEEKLYVVSSKFETEGDQI